jgi:heme exporter protein B
VSLLRELWIVAAKDLRIEARSRVTLGQVLPFGVVVLLLFAFALDPDRGILPRVAPGLFWVAVLLAALLAVSRAFAVEQANGAGDGLRLSGLDSGAMFLGKALAIAIQLLVLEVVLGLGVVVFYDLTPRAAEVLVPAALAATVGLAAAGTLYGVLAAGLRVRETLLPLLLLPVVAPVMLGATRAFEAGLGLNGARGEAWPWVEMLALFAVIYTTLGFLAFGPLLEEA